MSHNSKMCSKSNQYKFVTMAASKPSYNNLPSVSSENKKCESHSESEDINSLILDFGHVETLHSWRKLPECDEFVGARRSKHTMVAYNESVYVFGGDNGKTMLSDLLRYDIRDGSWVRAFSVGQPPAPRYHHSAVVYGSSMFIFGGYTGDIHSNSNLTNRNDLWEYKFGGGHWIEWKNTGPFRPVARSAHGAAVYDGKLFIFAGYDGNMRLNDMWAISLSNYTVPGQTSPVDVSLSSPSPVNYRTWEKIDSVGESPPTCCNFPIAVAGDSMFVFSGQSGAKITNSLFQFQFKSKTWIRITTDHILRDAPSPPSRRFGHSMIAYDRHLFVFGGAADNILPNSVHCFDIDTHMWSIIDPTQESQVPSGRLFHAAAIFKDQMFIFGGTVDNNIRSGEMYRFQMAAFPRCTLENDFGKMLESGQFCDVNFLLGDLDNAVVVQAHASIIAARCHYLQSKLRHAKVSRENRLKILHESIGPENIPNLEVRLPDADPKAFRLVLDFIYTDQIDPTKNKKEDANSDEVVLVMMRVFMLSVKFRMGRLEHLCQKYIEVILNLNNVLVALNNASVLSLVSIKESCLKFITKESNYSQIVMSKEFETLDQPLMVEIIRRRQGMSQPDSILANTHTPNLAAVTPGTSLKEDMKSFLTSEVGQEFSDITLLLETNEFKAHRAVLASRSAYFEGMFRSFNPQNNMVPISIGDIKPSKQSFYSLLRYVYYDDVHMPPEDCLYLFSAPIFYIFSNNRLQALCKHNLERNVTVENVIQILEAAECSQTHDMKKYALSLIVKHFPKVAHQARMLSLSRTLLLDIIHALADDMSEYKALRQDMPFSSDGFLNP